MCCSHEKICYIVSVNSTDTLDSVTASVLSLEVINSHSLDITKRCKSDYCIYIRDEVFIFEFSLIMSDLCLSVIAVFISDLCDFFFDNTKKEIVISKDSLKFSNLLKEFFVLSLKLVSFQTCESTKSHIYDSLRLCFRESETSH